MEMIFILLPIALVFSLGAVVAFIWAVRSDQMDDLDTPAMRILFDEEDLSGQEEDDVQEHDAENEGNKEEPRSL